MSDSVTVDQAGGNQLEFVATPIDLDDDLMCACPLQHSCLMITLMPWATHAVAESVATMLSVLFSLPLCASLRRDISIRSILECCSKLDENLMDTSLLPA